MKSKKKVGLQENATFSKVVKAEKGCLSCKTREKQHIEKARCLMQKSWLHVGAQKARKGKIKKLLQHLIY